MLINSVILLLREVLEAAMLISVLLALSLNLRCGVRWFWWSLPLAAVGAVWMSLGSKELEDENPGEYYVILLACTLGMFYMASAANLLMAYLALEFVSQTSYILSGFLKQNRRSSEAALKYLIYGGVASGAMVYGMSLIFGLTGSLDYAVIGERLAASEGNAPVIFVALVLILAGFGYKISMVPFHMWAPDVYEGAPLPVTAFLAVGSKAAGIAMLVRFFYPGVSSLGGDGTWIPRRSTLKVVIGEPRTAPESSFSGIVQLKEETAELISREVGEPRLDLVAAGPVG